MESHRNPFLTWACFYQEKIFQSAEELMHSLSCITGELEQTRIAAAEELRKRDERLDYLKTLLKYTLRERDEANKRYQKFMVEKLLLQQNNAPLYAISSVEDEPGRGVESNNGFSSSDCEESIVSSPTIDANPPLQQPPPLMAIEKVEILPAKPLPEKGHLLEAVMKAGPLLQTLLLAGPLPQWRHPPPPLETFEIPPVTIPSQIHNRSSPITINGGIKKRFLGETSEPPPETKFHKISLLNRLD